MFLPHFGLCGSRFRGISFLAPAALVLGLAVGCASPGPPRPPSLRLPNPVTDLRAERAGDAVRLTWTSPSRTTDGDPLRPGLQAALCRREAPIPKKSLICNEIGHLPVAPGVSQFTDNLPPAMAAGPAKLLEYRVEIRNATGRSAGPSSPAYAASGPAPPPAGPIHIEPRIQGAVISWHPESSSAPMRVLRNLTATASGPVAETDTLPRKKTPAVSGLGFGKPRTSSNEVTLVAETSGSDPGGLLDTTVKDGDTYTYTAQRVAGLTLDGHSLEVSGLPSSPVTITYRDVFAPKPPSGLVSVPGGGFGAAPSIDLSWEANSDPGTVSYNVYRAEGDQPLKLATPQLVQAPAWRDLHVKPGATYTYRVTAVDEHGNESVPSPEIHETLRK